VIGILVLSGCPFKSVALAIWICVQFFWNAGFDGTHFKRTPMTRIRRINAGFDGTLICRLSDKSVLDFYLLDY
jgi:hypothetical protein